jgi:hypothetical protein
MVGWHLLSRCLLALCVLNCTSISGAEQEVPGTYKGRAPAADAAQRVFTLNLASDGGAVLSTVFIGKGDVIQHGKWTQSGNQVVLTFDPMGPNKPPRPITFRHHGHELTPLHWDPSEWGRHGPPALHRSRPQEGGA